MNLSCIFKKWKKLPAILGIDLGYKTIKVVELEGSSHQLKILNYGIRSLSAHVIEGGQQKKLLAYADILKGLLNEHNMRANQAVIALPDSLVMTKSINIQCSTVHELEERIFIEAGKHLAHSLQNLYFDFSVTKVLNNQQYEVFLVAAKAEDVQPRLEILERVGIEPIIVYVESFALEKALSLFSVSNENPLAIIEIGSNHCRLFIAQANKIIFNYSDSPPKIRSDAFDYSSLLAELRRLMNIFYSQHQLIIDQALLIGELASDLTVIDRLKLDLQCSIISFPFAKRTLSANEEDFFKKFPDLMIAYSLALRGLVKYGF